MLALPSRTFKIAKANRGVVYWFAMALAIMAANLANEASFEFSALTGLFIVLVYLTVNALGGLKTVFGAVVGYIGFQHVILTCFAKFLLSEPIEARLQMPTTTMEIYCVGMTSMWCAALVLARFNPTRGKALFVPIVDAGSLQRMACVGFFFELGQIIITRLRYASLATGQASNGGVVALVVGMSFVIPLTVACATAAVAVRSGGRKSFGPVVFLTMIPPILGGLLGAGRIDSTIALIAYFVTAMLFGFRFKLWHWAAFAVLGFFTVYIVYPYSLAARSQVRGPDIGRNISKAIEIFGDVWANPARYQNTNFTQERQLTLEQKNTRFYDPPITLLERFSLIKETDLIVHGGLRHDQLGWQTTIDGLTMSVPSFFIADKPLLGDNNMLGHLAPGLVGRTDFVTQPNVGIFADAFVSFRWWGAALVPFVLLFLYVFIYRILVITDLTRNVFGISMALSLAHTFSEVGIGGQITQIVQAPITVLLGFATYRACAHLLDLKPARRLRPPERSQPTSPAV